MAELRACYCSETCFIDFCPCLTRLYRLMCFGMMLYDPDALRTPMVILHFAVRYLNMTIFSSVASDRSWEHRGSDMTEYHTSSAICLQNVFESSSFSTLSSMIRLSRVGLSHGCDAFIMSL